MMFKVRMTIVLIVYVWISFIFLSGLYRARDTLMAQLQDLNKSKPRNKVDENLMGEISRLESTITVTRDDFVSVDCYHFSVRSS
jgi:hypothetical protein